MKFLQALDRDVSIDLSSAERRVTEKLLNGAQFRSTVEQMRGESVPEGMGRGAREDPVEITADDHSHASGGKPPSGPRAYENRRLTRSGDCRPRVEPEFKGVLCESAEGHDPRLRSFALQANEACSEVDRVEIEALNLRESCTGSVKQFEHRPVSSAKGRFRKDSGEEPRRVGLGENFW